MFEANKYKYKEIIDKMLEDQEKREKASKDRAKQIVRGTSDSSDGIEPGSTQVTLTRRSVPEHLEGIGEIPGVDSRNEIRSIINNPRWINNYED